MKTSDKWALDGIVIFPMAGSEIADTLGVLQNDSLRVVVMATHVDSGYDALIMTNDADRGLTCAQMAADWIEKTFPGAVNTTSSIILPKSNLLRRSNATFCAVEAQPRGDRRGHWMPSREAVKIFSKG